MTSTRDRAAHPGLLLGWHRPAPSPAVRMGFGATPSLGLPPRRLLRYRGDGHLLCVAPTGAGKGTGLLIPNLLHYPGPVLVTDPKGENFRVTARRRRQLGHRVVALDPFGVAAPQTDRLNPFDLFALPGIGLDAEAEMFADLLTGGEPTTPRDPFWDLTSGGMLTGLVGVVAQEPEPAQRNLGAFLDLLYGDDVDYNLAVLLDTRKDLVPLIRQELVGYLSHESERCRPSVRSTAQARVKALGCAAVRHAMSASTFDLQALVRGEAVDVFLILPPDKLHSHRAVLRLWLGVLLTAILRRTRRPEVPTLVLLDECAQLGPLNALRQALTLLRGYGVQVWTFWQDLGQLKLLYPQDWTSIVNNSAVVQAFGLTNGLMARECAEVLGVPADRLQGLSSRRQAVQLPRRGTEVVGRLDYLRDRCFRGLYEANPWFGERPGRERRGGVSTGRGQG